MDNSFWLQRNASQSNVVSLTPIHLVQNLVILWSNATAPAQATWSNSRWKRWQCLTSVLLTLSPSVSCQASMQLTVLFTAVMKQSQGFTKYHWSVPAFSSHLLPTTALFWFKEHRTSAVCSNQLKIITFNLDKGFICFNFQGFHYSAAC